MNLQRIVIILAAIILISCASREEKLERTKEKVDAMKESLANIKGDNIYINEPDSRNRISYYLIDDKISFINEEIKTHSSHFINLYYYDNGKLIYLNSKGLDYQQTEEKFDKLAKNYSVYFNGTEILESAVIVNKAYVDLTDDEKNKILEYSSKIYNMSEEHLLNQ